MSYFVVLYPSTSTLRPIQEFTITSLRIFFLPPTGEDQMSYERFPEIERG